MASSRARFGAAGSSAVAPTSTNVVVETAPTALIPLRTFLAEFASAERDLERMAAGDSLIKEREADHAAAGAHLFATHRHVVGEMPSQHHPPSTDSLGENGTAPGAPVPGDVTIDVSVNASSSIGVLSAAPLLGEEGEAVRLEELVELSSECELRTVAESKRSGWLSRKGPLKVGNEEYVPASKRAKGTTGRHRGHVGDHSGDGDSGVAGAAAAADGDETRAGGESGSAITVTDGDEVLLTVAFYHQRKPLKLAEFEVGRRPLPPQSTARVLLDWVAMWSRFAVVRTQRVDMWLYAIICLLSCYTAVENEHINSISVFLCLVFLH